MVEEIGKERKCLEKEFRRMKPGERIDVCPNIFQRAYPCGFPSIYQTHEQAFLSSRVGSSWGVCRVKLNFESFAYIISRHEESDKRYYVDPDREHLFRRMPDGTLERR